MPVFECTKVVDLLGVGASSGAKSLGSESTEELLGVDLITSLDQFDFALPVNLVEILGLSWYYAALFDTFKLSGRVFLRAAKKMTVFRH